MRRSHKDGSFKMSFPSMLPLSRRRRPQARRSLIWSAFLPFIILSSILLNWAFLVPSAQAAPDTSLSTPGHNTHQQFVSEGNRSKADQGAFVRPTAERAAQKLQTNAKQNQPLPPAEPATMKDQTYLLDTSFVLHRPAMAKTTRSATVQGTAIPAGSTPLVFTGSDGRLEIDLPRGSLDGTHAALADGTMPVGQLFLQIHQLSGHWIEEESILGTYQVQIVDSLGHVVQGVVLTQPATIVYHYQGWEMQDLDLDPTQVHLSWPGTIAAQAAKQPNQMAATSAAAQQTGGLVIPMTNNARAGTLTAQTLILGGVMTASGTPEIAPPARPDLFEVSGNSGQYSTSYPFTLAPGPDGFAPQLQLVYSSQSTNDRFSRRAPAGDEGEGFSLSLGSITAAPYPSTSTGGAATWYSINDVDGVSDKLVPFPNKANYYETEHLSHLLIKWTGSCWNVWGKEGSFFTLGCTADSLQKTSSGTYEWDLNEMLAPYNDPHQVKTMLVSYVQDSPDGGATIRDSAIKQIQYGYATQINASSLSLVSGTVDFHYHAPTTSSGKDGLGTAWTVAYGNNYHCVSAPLATTTLRCDDPLTDGSVTAPSVMSTMTLDSITSYVGADTSASNKVASYAETVKICV